MYYILHTSTDGNHSCYPKDLYMQTVPSSSVTLKVKGKNAHDTV